MKNAGQEICLQNFLKALQNLTSAGEQDQTMKIALIVLKQNALELEDIITFIKLSQVCNSRLFCVYLMFVSHNLTHGPDTRPK